MKKRVLFVKSTCLLFAFAIILSLYACGSTQNAQTMTTDPQIGSVTDDAFPDEKTAVFGLIKKPIDFNAAFDKADLVVTVRIKKAEKTYQYEGTVYGETVFAAEILKTHKCGLDGIGKTINIVQFCVPQRYDNVYVSDAISDLFNEGEILFLQLTMTDAEKGVNSTNECERQYTKDFGRCFNIINGIGVARIIVYNGVEYVVNNVDDDYFENTSILTVDKNTDTEIRNYMAEKAIVERGAIRSIHKYDEVLKYIKKIGESN